jgi:hypothetical protein
MTINFKELFSRAYLIKIDANQLHPTDCGLFYLGLGLTVLGAILLVTTRLAMNQFSREFRRRLCTWALTIGLVEVLWFGFRYQNAQVLGSHLAAFIVLLAGLVWLYFILRYRFGSYRSQLQQWEKDQLKQKYLQRR